MSRLTQTTHDDIKISLETGQLCIKNAIVEHEQNNLSLAKQLIKQTVSHLTRSLKTIEENEPINHKRTH